MKIEEALAIVRRDSAQALYHEDWAEHEVFLAFGIEDGSRFREYRVDVNRDSGERKVTEGSLARGLLNLDVTTREFLSDRWEVIYVGGGTQQ